MKIKKTLLGLPLVALAALSSGCNKTTAFNAQTALKKILDKNVTMKGEVLIDRDETTEKCTYAKFEIREQAVTSSVTTELGIPAWVKYTEKENPTSTDYENALYYYTNRFPIQRIIAIPTVGSTVQAAGVPDTFDPFETYVGVLTSFVPKQYCILDLVEGFLKAAYHSPFEATSPYSATISSSYLGIEKTAIFKATANGADISKFSVTMSFNDQSGDKDVEVIRVNEITYAAPDFSGIPTITYAITDVKAVELYKDGVKPSVIEPVIEINVPLNGNVKLKSDVLRYKEKQSYEFTKVTYKTDKLTSKFTFDSTENTITPKDAQVGDTGYIFCECGGRFSNIVKLTVTNS